MATHLLPTPADPNLSAGGQAKTDRMTFESGVIDL